jgi:hypothetical protein
MGQVLAHMLEEEGVRVEQQPPPAHEQRDLASMLESVDSGLEVYGTTVAIDGAVDRFRKLFPDAGCSVTIEGDCGER